MQVFLPSLFKQKEGVCFFLSFNITFLSESFSTIFLLHVLRYKTNRWVTERKDCEDEEIEAQRKGKQMTLKRDDDGKRKEKETRKEMLTASLLLPSSFLLSVLMTDWMCEWKVQETEQISSPSNKREKGTKWEGKERWSDRNCPLEGPPLLYKLC